MSKQVNIVATNNDGTTIKLYWLDKSRAQRVVWLLEETNVPYEIEIFHRGKDMLAPPELKKIHPLGKSPVVEISGAPGQEPGKSLVLAETGMIASYLTQHFAPQLQPKQWKEGKEGLAGGETDEWLRYQYFLYYNEGSLMPFLVMLLVTENIRNAPVPFFIRWITAQIAKQVETSFVMPNVKSHMDFLEQTLKDSGGPWLCGSQLTAADILMTFPMEALKWRGGMTKEKYPQLMKYGEELVQQPGWKRSVAKIEALDGEFKPLL